jgi:hypothetical protein
MKSTVFLSSSARILFSSIMFLAGCGGLSNTIPAPGAANSAQGTSAFVCVLSNPSSNNFAINAFSAKSNGQLTPVPGSPFAANVEAIAANRNYLFGTDGSSIDSFSIGSNGALTKVSSINGLQFNPHGGLSGLFLDRTGTTLYSVHFLIDDANDGYESYSVNQSTGALSYLGATFVGCCGDGPLSFMENNLYGYTTSCFHGFLEISGFKRNNDGTLTASGSVIDFPDPSRLCPGKVAAGPTSNLAVSFGADGGPGVPPQGSGVALAVYTVDSSGGLTTISTVANMPQTAIGGNIVMSPSGKFLALGGLGLEVFHFNGAAPITPFTGLLMNDPADQISWDNDNNLYAISRSASKLSVFTATTASVTQASGSPYTITNPTAIVVVPRN